MAIERLKFTYEDYLHTPEDKRYELIGGDLIMVPAPGLSHQEVSKNLYEELARHVRQKGKGVVYYSPIDVILSHVDVVQPDIVFVSKERVSILREKGICGAPDLIIEILSPSSEYIDRETKRKLYSRYKVREYWIVDPKSRSIEVTRLVGGILKTVAVYPEGKNLRSPLLKGLRMDVKKVLSRPGWA